MKNIAQSRLEQQIDQIYTHAPHTHKDGGSPFTGTLLGEMLAFNQRNEYLGVYLKETTKKSQSQAIWISALKPEKTCSCAFKTLLYTVKGNSKGEMKKKTKKINRAFFLKLLFPYDVKLPDIELKRGCHWCAVAPWNLKRKKKVAFSLILAWPNWIKTPKRLIKWK